MRMHIIGVATEFMTGIATLAREAGHDVTASDHLIDNKTRHELEKIGVNLQEGFNKDHLAYKPDLVVIGKEVDLNNQEVVAVHRLAIPNFSGAEWLEKYVLDEDVIKKIMPTAAATQKSRNPHIPDKPIKHAPKIPLDSHSKTKRVTQ